MPLIKQRFLWPSIDTYIKNKVASCERCIKRKAGPDRSKLVNITSTTPMKIVCLDYLTLEISKGGFEKILIITDHFSRYAQAIPTRNETAKTTERVLFDNYIVHYGFPAHIYRDQGANFESNLIKELCKIAGVEKSRTTPYHTMGSRQVERLTKPYSKCLGLFKKTRKVTRRHMSLLWSMPTMPHFMTELGFHLIFICLGATLGWPLMPSLIEFNYSDRVHKKTEGLPQFCIPEGPRGVQESWF